MAEKVEKPPEKPKPESYDHNDATPGIWIGDGHVISDKFGEMYGNGPMTDEELAIELKARGVARPEDDEDIDHPEDEDIDYPATEGIVPRTKPRPPAKP